MRKTNLIYFSACVFLAVFLSSCSKNVDTETPNRSVDQAATKTDVQDWLPIDLENEKFEKVYGWLDNSTIVYSVTVDDHSVLKSYQSDGTEKILFTSTSPIINVEIHSKDDVIFIHTSTTSHTANISFINDQGSPLYTTEIESYELDYEWNPTDASLMIISAFDEDWTFESFLLNTELKQLNAIPLQQPFVKWFGKRSLILQEWSEEVSQLASLTRINIEDISKKEELSTDVYKYDVLGDNLMSIKINQQDQNQLLYEFHDSSMKSLGNFAAYHLTNYAGWLIPYYDFVDTDNQFFTFAPKYFGSEETYDGQYDLLSVDVHSGAKTLVMEDLDNKPLQCSPNGNACLYGHQFETIIDLKNQQLHPLLRSKQKAPA